jgi:transmembrane sensor
LSGQQIRKGIPDNRQLHHKPVRQPKLDTVQTNDAYILLLSKQFAGDALPPDEAALLSQWLKQSPEHQQLAAEMQQVWEKTGASGASIPHDLDADFRQLQARIRATEKPSAKIVPLGRWLLRAAAALALLAVSVWAWQNSGTAAAPEPTLLVASADRQLVELPDGSRVWLRQNAALRYPAHFSEKTRRVQLSGEAYFEVAHNPAQPFQVVLPTGDEVQVLGTEFGISLSPDGSRTEVSVRSGKVRFSPKEKPDGVVLTARQSATYHRATAQLAVRQNATLNNLAWHQGGLEFVKTPLRDALSDLERHYNVKIQLLNPALNDCLYTSPRTNQPIQKVLASIAIIYQLQVVETAQGQFELRGGKCR